MQQLEFNITNETELELRLSEMEKHIDEMHQTMDKVRKKLFSQLDYLQKLCLELQNENRNLKTTIRELSNEEKPWIYRQDGRLFDLREFEAK